jgi:chaperonin GroES
MSRRAQHGPVPPTQGLSGAAGEFAPAAEGDQIIILPLLDRVLVRRVEPASHTAGGILLLEDARPVTHTAIVHAVGPGRRNRNGSRRTPLVKPGDHVLLHLLAGARSEIQLVAESGGELVQFVHQDDIQGIILGGSRLIVTEARA